MSRRARTHATDVRIEVYAGRSAIVGSGDHPVDALESIAPVLFIGLSPIVGNARRVVKFLRRCLETGTPLALG